MADDQQNKKGPGPKWPGNEEVYPWLAEQKDVLSTILKTGKLPSPQVVGAESEEEDASHAA